jgi:K(+)-stimulated pyrophosphate-energized sodium pump
VLISLVCGALAVVYGLALTRWVLSQSAGTERMQEISGAVQEGAAAYLKRQYTTIAIVGIVVAIIIGIFLKPLSAVAFLRARSRTATSRRRRRSSGSRSAAR